MFMNKVYFIRHAECKSLMLKDSGNILNDKLNTLTKQGVAESKELGAFFFRFLPNLIVYSSPILRAYQTSSEISKFSGIQMQIDERLEERYFGFPEDTTMAMSKEYQQLSHLNPSQSICGGETVQQHRQRVESWLYDFEISFKQNFVYLIVTHGGTIDQLQSILFGNSFDSNRRFFIPCNPAHFHEWTVRSVNQTLIWSLDSINSSINSLNYTKK